VEHMEEMEEKEIMKFRDEDGEVIELEIVEKLLIDNDNYLILAPLDDEDDAYVYKVVEENDSIRYIEVEDDNEFNRVLEKYTSLFEEE